MIGESGAAGALAHLWHHYRRSSAQQTATSLPAATPRPCPGHVRHVGPLSAHFAPRNGTPHAAHGVRRHPAACAVGVQGCDRTRRDPDPHPRLPGLIAANQGHFADRARTSQSPQTLRSDSGLCEDPVTAHHAPHVPGARGRGAPSRGQRHPHIRGLLGSPRYGSRRSRCRGPRPPPGTKGVSSAECQLPVALSLKSKSLFRNPMRRCGGLERA